MSEEKLPKTDAEIIIMLGQMLKTAKEENNEKRKQLNRIVDFIAKHTEIFGELKNQSGYVDKILTNKILFLTQQNKQMREALEKVKKDACCSNGDCEHCEYDEDCFGYDAQQALKGGRDVNNSR